MWYILSEEMITMRKKLKHEVGKTYYIGYWHTTYKVLEILPSEIFGEKYKCLWADGSISTHCTQLDPRNDYEVKGDV